MSFGCLAAVGPSKTGFDGEPTTGFSLDATFLFGDTGPFEVADEVLFFA